MVEGAGGKDVRAEAAAALACVVDGAVRLRARDGARPAMTKTRMGSSALFPRLSFRYPKPLH